MPRRAAADPALDHGPRIGGSLPASVVVSDRADPDNPNRTIRGASRRSGYDWLHARGVISDTQREAADRYCVAHERMAGAREHRADMVSVRVPAWQQGHPTLMQVQAAGDIREAHEAIGGDVNRTVLSAVVLSGRTLDALAVELSEPVPGIVGRLRAVLDILAWRWGIE